MNQYIILLSILREDVDISTGTGEANLLEAEALLQPYLQKFPKVL